MSIRPYACSAAATVLIFAGAALAQEREIGALERNRPPERPVSLADGPGRPANDRTEAWLSKEVMPGDWRLVSKEAAGAIFAKPTGAVQPDGVVPMHLRLEYAQPFDAAKRQFRSVQLDLTVNCGNKRLNGDVNAFEGQNLSGKKMYFEPGEVLVGRTGGKPETQNLRAAALKLMNSQIVRQQCAEGHRSLAAKYGPAWRPLLQDDRGVRLVSGAETYGLDRKLDLKFRIEAREPQSTPALRWRSAIADLRVDCAAGAFSADATLYSGADESGESAKLAFDAMATPLGVRTAKPGEKPAPPKPPAPGASRAASFAAFAGGGFGDEGPGKTVVDLLLNGGLVMGECDAAKARLAQALATPGDPVRREAETWAAQNLNTKGFRLPTYMPEGVLMLSDEVVASTPDVRRAVVRTEFNRPIPGRDGKTMGSRITVIEVDCAGHKVRGVSESVFARNGAKELIKETPAPAAVWSAFDDQPTMAAYFEAVCTTKPS
jgi:hypothetical protein